MERGDASPDARAGAFPTWRLVLRFLSLAGLSVWIGGFTFYSAAVVPVLHEDLGGVEAGSVTRRVTDRLNAVGVVTLVVWWTHVLADRATRSPGGRRARLWTSIATS